MQQLSISSLQPETDMEKPNESKPAGQPTDSLTPHPVTAESGIVGTEQRLPAAFFSHLNQKQRRGRVLYFNLLWKPWCLQPRE